MNIYVALGMHVIFAILWFFDSATLQRRRERKAYYSAVETNNKLLEKAAKSLVTELDAWMSEKEKKSKSSSLPDAKDLNWEELRSRLNHPTNTRWQDYEVDVTHILKDKIGKNPKKPRNPWYYFTPAEFIEREEPGRPDGGMWKKPKTDE